MATRKLVMDVDLEAEDEDMLDAVEAELRSLLEVDPGEDIVERTASGMIVRYRITAAEITNEGPVEC